MRCFSNKLIGKKRIFAFLLVVIITLSPILGNCSWFKLTVDAADIRVTQSGGNLLDGVPFDYYGHGGRTGIWMWKDSNGHPLFCLQPTMSMQTGAGMGLDRISLDEDWGVDLDNEQKELIYYAMAVAGCGVDNTKISQGQYIMVQSAIWAIVSGEWTTVEDFRNNMDSITSHIRTNRVSVKAEIDQLIDAFVIRVNQLVGDNSEYIPRFASKKLESAPVNYLVDKGNGVYEITFENTVKDLEFVTLEGKPPVGWTIRYEGSNLVFTCDTNVGGEKALVLMGKAIPGTGLATLFTPGNVGILKPDKSNNQIMIAQVEAGETWHCFTRFVTSNPIPEVGEGTFSLEVHRYEHDETFKSNYKIELVKTDSETGSLLADTTFSVLEAFNMSQLNETNLERNQFAKEPTTLTEHVQATSDENGYLSHGDTKSYTYSKTYCGGHPDPVIEYVPLIESEGNGEEEQAAIDEVNAQIEENNAELERRAWEAWQNEVDSCADDCDFHSIEEGEAASELEEHRNQLWNQFINLKYSYTVQEVHAGNGYTLHDYHSDDLPIDIVSFASSQAGGEGEIIGTYVKGEASYGENPPIATFDDTEVLRKSDGESSGWDGSWEDSNVSLINQGRYEKNKFGFCFRISNHRTEGEIHINKRDLELNRKDGDKSYGQSQGDATLEGAVYGLYAASDIFHPDGQTGKVFSEGELVAVASTDRNGDASFVAVTELTETSMAVPNLYMSNKSLNGLCYPDNVALNGGQWIGRPLFLGSYYIEEIARSEGYELSKFGINLTESNRQGNAFTIAKSGSVSVNTLTHRINEWDGSWNDFTANYYNTANGFDIYVDGYPAGSKFYTVDGSNTMVNHEVVTSITQQPKTDAEGNIIYKTAAGGELKYDTEGNYIIKVDGEGNPLYDDSNPLMESFVLTNRLNYYPNNEPVTENEIRYDEANIDTDFVMTEVSDLLSQIGYRNLEEQAPAVKLVLSGTTNGEMIEEILDYCKADTFWDSYNIEDIYHETTGEGTEEDPEVTKWYAVIRYGYTMLSNATNFYDEATKRVIIKRECEYDRDGSTYTGFCYLIFQDGDYVKAGNRVTINKVVIQEPVVFGQEPVTQDSYPVLYDTYEPGELMLDGAGNPIPETETAYTYGNETVDEYHETLTEVTNITYVASTGTYIIHITNDVDWSMVNKMLTKTFRGVAPAQEKDGMPYADYITQKDNGRVSAVSNQTPLAEGSYVKNVVLLYPEQTSPYQDAGTREKPIVVLQRVIKQAVKVVKNISLKSYDQINTYSIHKDAYTAIHGGYHGKQPANALPGFYFKIYLVSDLLETGGLNKKPEGSYDYEEFFANKTNEPLYQSLAVEWDKMDKDVDGDLTTIHANVKGHENYYGTSNMLAYGTYVIVEQQPKELLNKHYKIDDPKEIILPFVPEIAHDGTVYDIPSRDYYYDSTLTAEQLMEKYFIRFNEETHVIKAHNRDGDFEIYKFGLSQGSKPTVYDNTAVAQYYKYDSNAENAGNKDAVYYDTYVDRDGSVTDYGITLNNVATMVGKSEAIDRKYASALVPWTVLDPRYGEVINDNGDLGNREAGLVEGKFNFVSFAQKGFENDFYNSVLRIEKVDSETGENIIHDGAYFKIYAAQRDLSGEGLTGVNGTGQVKFGEDGLPLYNEEEQIYMKDETGAEVGIFKAFSSIREVITVDGIKKLPVGYIETYQPLGAGVYVLVEVSAPAGYVKSPPVAFEIYSDEVTYYYNGDSNDRRVAEQYQYVIPFTDSTKTVSQIYVEDKPSHVSIYKVEDGIEKVTYEVRGSKALLEKRGDVENLQYDPINKEWFGNVTKHYDEWSEHMVYGTEEQLKTMENVKLLYDVAGRFLGKGIRFDISVSEATLSLYKGLQVELLADGGYKGISVEYKNDKVSRITISETGTYADITTKEKDITPAKNNLYDSEDLKNPPVDILFYDLTVVANEIDADTGILYILDEQGNRTCMADQKTGMAYVMDDYGNRIVYPVDENNNKVLSQSIKIHKNADGSEYIYTDKNFIKDENGLPLYYESGNVTLMDDEWVTHGNKHEIARLPFGAFILEEKTTPYDQGYIRTKHIGFLLKETSEEQKVFLEDDFTKINIGKVDIKTKAEILDAHMTLYYATRIADDSERGWHLEIATNEAGEKLIRTSWISGYEYDDNGNPIMNNGSMVETSKTHWVNHIPVGDYILEETQVPFHYGYVQSEPMEVIVEETGKVQTYIMQDDFT